jgi:CheY-like chemotaxis protein
MENIFMSKTALVVDDSKSARFALRKYLESMSYHVDTAESAEEAYRFLKSHHPDLIFLDHVMPGTDGFEALRHLKNDPHTGAIPVVICSSNEGEEFTSEARRKGAVDVLQKPPSPDQLASVLENLQRLSASLKAMPRAAEVPPQAPAKVSNIREPEVAIEQAVMKVLRTSLPRSEPPPAFTPPPPSFAGSQLSPAGHGSSGSSGLSTPASRATQASDAAMHAMRDQMEQRLKKITQDLFMQIAELKANVAHIDSRLRPPEDEQAAFEQMLQASTEAMQERLEMMERRVDSQLDELRGQIDAALQAQSERINQVAQAARAAAAEEAHAATERTVMSAASRIADQLADAILKALGRH